MAWVKLDDQAPRNRKMLRAGPAACWLWVCGIAHCQSQLTDGFIANEALPMIGVPGTSRCRKLSNVLVDAGLFNKTDGGYVVHDYLDFNQSRAQVIDKRNLDAERKRATESSKNPNGIKPDSVKPPDGIQVESGGPRAGVPSHPIPTVPIREDSLQSAAAQKVPVNGNGNGIYDPDHGERAGRLVNHYGELFVKYRYGAKYKQRPNLDWHDALTLVPVWDDDRLEKLAVLVLTTDDPWIASTDRGFKIFAMKASWADDRLRAWEVENQVQV